MPIQFGNFRSVYLWRHTLSHIVKCTKNSDTLSQVLSDILNKHLLIIMLIFIAHDVQNNHR